MDPSLTAAPLDPSIVAYLQGQGQDSLVDPQQVASTLGPRGGSIDPGPQPMPQLPPSTTSTMGPRGRNNLGVNGGTGVDELAAPDDPGPTSVTGGQLHPALQQAIQGGFQPQPDYQLSPKQAAPIQKADADADAAFAKAQAVQAKQQAKQAALAATPEGQQQQAYQQQVAGNDDLAAIAKQEGDLVSNEALKDADIKAQAAIDMKAEVQKQEQKRQEMLAQQNALHADMMKAVDIAQKKTIDPNRMWNNMSTGGKIALKIGIILSGLGNGMSGNGSAPNQAAQMFEEDIKNDIEAQKADMGQANDVVGMKRNALDDYMKIAGNTDAAATMKQAEMRNMVASQLEANAAKFKSPQALLAAQQTAAVMRQKSATDLMDLAGKRVAQQHQAAELANQRRATDIAGGHLALAGKQFDYEQKKDERDFKEKQREYDDTLGEKILTAKSQGNATAAANIKDIREHGLRDPSTGDIILTPKGEQMKAQADALEVQARGKTPEEAAAMRTQAQALRDQAEQSEHISHEKAPEVQDSLNSAQNVVDTVSDIKAELAKDPGMTDRATWAKLAERYANAKASAIGFFKAKPSSREMEAFEEFMGPDGGKMLDRGFSKEKMIAQADALSQSISSDADTTLRGAGYKGKYRIQAHNGEALAPLAPGKTAVEAGAGAERGTVGAQLPDADLKFRSNDTRQLQAENAADTGPTGLSKPDTQTVSGMVKRYDAAPDAERAKILTQLTAYANSPRETVSNGVLTLLRDNPEVYQQVLSTLPPDRQAALKQVTAGIPQVHVAPGGAKFVTPSFVPAGGIPRK